MRLPGTQLRRGACRRLSFKRGRAGGVQVQEQASVQEPIYQPKAGMCGYAIRVSRALSLCGWLPVLASAQVVMNLYRVGMARSRARMYLKHKANKSTFPILVFHQFALRWIPYVRAVHDAISVFRG